MSMFEANVLNITQGKCKKIIEKMALTFFQKQGLSTYNYYYNYCYAIVQID